MHDDACPGLLLILDRLTDAPPLPLLDAIATDDAWAWNGAQSDHADEWDWRRPDTLRRAAVGLRARCDAADLFASALLADRSTAAAPTISDTRSRCSATAWWAPNCAG